MKKLLSRFAVSLMVCFMISGVTLAVGGAQAADQDRDRDQTQDRDRDPARDGSCKDAIEQNNSSLLFVRNGSGTGDRDQTQDRDPAQDGSCDAS